MKIKTGFFFLLILLLNGCSVFVGPKQANSDWKMVEKNQLKNFSTNGRLSVNFDGKGYSAHFLWQKTFQIEQLDVSTPLGGTVGQICQDKSGFIATTDKETYTAKTITDLSQQLMGFDLPLDNLNYWTQGFIVPNQTHQITPEGDLEQMGWRIKRTVLAGDKSKSRRLELVRKDMAIRIVFDDFDYESLLLDESTICNARLRVTE